MPHLEDHSSGWGFSFVRNLSTLFGHMDQATLRQYAADGLRRQIAMLTQQLQELERPARKPTKRAAQNPTKAPKRKSMWTPERRAALSKKMKQLAAEKKKGK